MRYRLNFKRWLMGENEEEEDTPSPPPPPSVHNLQNTGSKSPLGQQIHHQLGIWLLPFRAAKKDPVEGWYIDITDHPGSVHDIKDVKIGDKVSDYSLNFTPYWTVSGVDEDKGLIYLNPIPPNPFLTGIGAGGHKFSDHDYEVHSGEHETKRTDQIMQQWKAGEAHDTRDVAYLLLGTVPTHVGPNGSQGGWYSSRDSSSNRGGQRGLDAAEIQKKDANTLKNVFKFDVPDAALRGELDSHDWDSYVNGDDRARRHATKIAGEDFDDPKRLAQMILTHRQPKIKERNAEALIDLYTGHTEYNKRREQLRGDYSDSAYEKLVDQHKNKEFAKPELAGIIKDVMTKLAKLHAPNQDKRGSFDPYWHVKEKFIQLASEEGWLDVLRLYEKSIDPTNRRYVFYGYEQAGKTDAMLAMLERETSMEALASFLPSLLKVKEKETLDWIRRNRDRLDKQIRQAQPDSSDSYYAKQVANVIGKRHSSKLS